MSPAADEFGNSVVSQALGVVVTEASLGALVRHLESLGILENTVILFKADHGIESKGLVRISSNRLCSQSSVCASCLLSLAGCLTMKNYCSSVPVALAEVVMDVLC